MTLIHTPGQNSRATSTAYMQKDKCTLWCMFGHHGKCSVFVCKRASVEASKQISRIFGAVIFLRT